MGLQDKPVLPCWYCVGRDGMGRPYNPDVHKTWDCEACAERANWIAALVESGKPSKANPSTTDLLDLLAKFTLGIGGRRTGELMRRGFIKIEVTSAGHTALEKYAHEVDIDIDPFSMPSDPGLSGERLGQVVEVGSQLSPARSPTAGENPAPGTSAVMSAEQVQVFREEFCVGRLCDSHEALRTERDELRDFENLDVELLKNIGVVLDRYDTMKGRDYAERVEDIVKECTLYKTQVEVKYGKNEQRIEELVKDNIVLQAKVTELEKAMKDWSRIGDQFWPYAQWEKYTLLEQKYDGLLEWACSAFRLLEVMLEDYKYRSFGDELHHIMQNAPAAVRLKTCDACEGTGPILLPHTCNIPGMKP